MSEIMEPVLSQDEISQLASLQREFFQQYAHKAEHISLGQWLNDQLQHALPDHSPEETSEWCGQILDQTELLQQKQAQLQKAKEDGRSKESWLADELVASTKRFANQEKCVAYLQNLDVALTQANQSLLKTISTKDGGINQNPQLKGFLAEEMQAQTFNLNATAAQSSYRAQVLKPSSGYKKNSVDIVIKNTKTGSVSSRYQAKYYKDSRSTEAAFEKGQYNGQQKLVPEGQKIGSKSTEVLTSPDGVTSNPLSVQDAQQLQDMAQSGNWEPLSWNNYNTKTVAAHIAIKTGQAALLGMAVSSGVTAVEQMLEGEEPDVERVAAAAMTAGADVAVNSVATAALKVGVEKGAIKILPPGTPAGILADIVFVGMENGKVLKQVAEGEIAAYEAFNAMEETTIAAVAGITASAEGAEIGMAVGTAVGTVLGLEGSVVGCAIGGIIGYIAGSAVGRMIARGAQMMRKATGELLRTAGSAAKNIWNSVSCGLAEVFG